MEEKEQELQFPCEYPIKIMGKVSEDFEAAVGKILKKHGGEDIFTVVSRKESAKGTYLSITVTFVAQGREDVDAIYRDLSLCEHVVMTM
ncbi:MAG: DUF493 domain-containing protein [Waddliaceae bacterium]|jgi:uncharacterized protein|nr:DUF493 domain-containing protein [Waddliaceae bacterium]MBT3579173.1 DUF493 domain-containing protein [Waddliaceae bacterium]MBT4445341.1 DUF493 domain-containing protein [Waddliaceae bacterium]MBT6928163.1 DUF493 domain-containing protein [Waddliaceae bacterium]MBT7264246.1 DUF493 domain-containing protein [Waddliaceae bacterium]